MLELQNISAGYGKRPVLREVTLVFPDGRVTALLGANGCGKSTLLRAAAGLLRPTAGRILLDGTGRETLSPREAARRLAYLPQLRPVPDITARRLVLHGRFPYLSYPRQYRREDEEAAERALEQAGAAALAERRVPELSGGERQRVYLAMALAQETATVLLDEPTTYLDVRCQLETMELLRALARAGKAVGVVLHDLQLAMRYADRLAVMEAGRLLQTGTPAQLCESGALERALGVRIGKAQTEDGAQYYAALRTASAERCGIIR